ncbi:MAG: ParB/RepB/Spo0J family partition protein [Alphaproteobacteria bacterium]|nr:ParB/RepB/Spo0J family partition protein [Alphaproteobacteria bacterium]
MSTASGDGGLKPRGGLGKGLAALLGDVAPTASAAALRAEAEPRATNNSFRTLPIDALRPSPIQPRTVFDEAELDELAQSIKQNGVLQPILVRQREGGGYEIIAGERRWRAAQRAGIHELPAVVRELNDDQALELALVENLQREDLNPLEEAEAFQRLVTRFGHTQDAVAQAIGKSRSHVANMIRLLDLPPYVKTLLGSGQLTMGHARALLNARDPVALAETIVARNLNVRQAEAMAREATRVARPPRIRAGRDPNVRDLEQRLSASLGLKVSIETKSDGSGEVIFCYQSVDQLDELLRRLGPR